MGEKIPLLASKKFYNLKIEVPEIIFTKTFPPVFENCIKKS